MIRKSLLLALATLTAQAAWAAPAAARLDAAAPARYIEHVKTLAAPEMRGRGAGMPELEQAGDYIVEQFRAIGLQPGGLDGKYKQPFVVTTGAKLGERNRLVASNVAGEHAVEVGEGYVPISFSSSGSVSGPVVFTGYGISAEEQGYDDYFHLDVKGKIVVVLRYEPPSFTEDKRKNRRYTHHANLIAKAINARNRGAKAVILVNGDGDEDKLIEFGSIAGPDDAGILMIQAKNAVVDRWLRRSGKSLDLLQKEINGKNEPSSHSLSDKFSLEIEVDIEREAATVHNVLGYLPGETDEYIVIGAHYDHLGLGGESSLAPDSTGTPHHGADDNASGTAGVIELARRFASGEKPKRGILFMTFAGEEIGLLGSAHWTESPTRPLDKAVAMLNMDMIGRISKKKVYVGGVGTADEFDPLVKRIGEDYSFKIDYSRSGYSASDHTSFTAKSVPVMFFFSGLHSDYHKPSDTWDKVNAKEAVELLAMVGEVADELIAAEDRPEFVKSAPDANPHGGSPSGSGGGGYGPYFGSIPDFAEIPDGVRFADIRPDSPAAKAGLESGDVMTSFGGKPIKNLYDFTYALRDSKVGQTVEVKFLRDGKEQAAQVTLEKRR